MFVSEEKIKTSIRSRCKDREFITMVEETKKELNRKLIRVPTKIEGFMIALLTDQHLTAIQCLDLCNYFSDPKICQDLYILVLAGEARGERGYMFKGMVEILKLLNSPVMGELTPEISKKIFSTLVYRCSEIRAEKGVKSFMALLNYLMENQELFIKQFTHIQEQQFLALQKIFVELYRKSTDKDLMIGFLNNFTDTYLALHVPPRYIRDGLDALMRCKISLLNCLAQTDITPFKAELLEIIPKKEFVSSSTQVMSNYGLFRGAPTEVVKSEPPLKRRKISSPSGEEESPLPLLLPTFFQPVPNDLLQSKRIEISSDSASVMDYISDTESDSDVEINAAASILIKRR